MGPGINLTIIEYYARKPLLTYYYKQCSTMQLQCFSITSHVAMLNK